VTGPDRIWTLVEGWSSPVGTGGSPSLVVTLVEDSPSLVVTLVRGWPSAVVTRGARCTGLSGVGMVVIVIVVVMGGGS
jgi:hypothetical protein